MELAILAWALIGAGITAGAFLIARAAVQIASVAYAYMEQRLDRRTATRQTILLAVGGVVAIGATALIAALAILALLAAYLEGSTF